MMKYCDKCDYKYYLCRCSPSYYGKHSHDYGKHSHDYGKHSHDYGKRCHDVLRNCYDKWEDYDEKPYPCPPKPPKPRPKPEPKPERKECKVVCNNSCGNILLSDQIQYLEIWRKSIAGEATVTISVFNSAMSTGSLRVVVNRNAGNPVELSVPPGNTLSATVENAESISVTRFGWGRTEGKYCLEVCFPIVCEKN